MNNIIYLNMVEMERNHWWYKGRREIIGKLLTPFLKSDMQMLDAGCGAGGTMEYMTKYGSIVGTDISDEMVEHCRKLGLSAYCENIINLSFEDEMFDLVLCLDVLEHLPEEMTALEELKRVIRPGGLLVLSVPAYRSLWGKHDELNNHYRRYNFGELLDIIKKADLTLERSTYFNFFLLPTVWLIRRFGGKLPFLNSDTDFNYGAGRLNGLLYRILKLELYILNYINLPTGVSQVVIARKN
jgi:SAM-dependent methyltransferase